MLLVLLLLVCKGQVLAAGFAIHDSTMTVFLWRAHWHADVCLYIQQP